MPITYEDSIPFIDLNNKEVIEEQIRKIKRYKSIEGETVRHLPTNIIKEETKLRSLAESFNEFEDVRVVDPNTEPINKIQSWLMRSIRQYTSNIVLYPYNFQYEHILEDKTKLKKNYEQGAFISLNPEELDSFNIGLKTHDTLKIKKAKALYDGDIAIFNINGDKETMKNINYFDSAIDWCTYLQTYLGKGICLGNFQDFLKRKQGASHKSFTTWINETEIIKGSLMNGGLPRFKIFIIPDYIGGAESIIKSKLTAKGMNQIKAFYDNGGIIFAAGKSGFLLEDINLVKKGTYNNKILLSVNNADRKISTRGCEDTFNKQYSEKEDDFKKRMICSSIKKTNEICISSTFFVKNWDPSFEPLIYVNTSHPDLRTKNADSGQLLANLTEAQKENITLIAHKSNNKNGQIFLLHFNPMFSGGDRRIILNLLLLSLSKELYLNSKVTMSINKTEIPDMPIPAGEAGINLEVNTNLHNLDDKPINNCSLYVFLPDNFNWTDIPNQCIKSKNKTLITKEVTNRRTVKSDNNEFLLCNLGTLKEYQKYKFKITIQVLNYKATQMKYEVLILDPILSFVDKYNLSNIFTDSVRVNCEAAPLLRAAINPDPSAFYPVKGEGQYVDNVVKVENKEQSGALEVEYVGLIPIISPLTDGDDQRKTQWNLKIYVDYYNKDNNFIIPFPKNNDNVQDFIYTGYLQGKGAIIVTEWDSPVLPVKETIDPKNLSDINITENVDLKGINLGMVTINKTNEIIKQINYRQSDRFYKLASQRLMVFIDDSTPEGTKTLYGSSDKIPKEWSFGGDRAKREFLFTRSDIYFYENENYANPPKITEKVIFSVDKFKKYENKNCVKNRGEARSKVLEAGYFTNQDNTKKVTILKPNIYSNELFEYCDLTVIDPTNKDEIVKFFGSTDNIRPVHYIVPNVEKSITKPSQIYKFTETNQNKGYHNDYPSIQFLYLHTCDLTIINKTCLYGGRIIIELGTYTIKSNEDVTISPDQIAVYKTVYDSTNKKIFAYFRRGLMSNEQFGKNLNIKINIENLSITKDVPLNIIIEEMKYDISFKEGDYERYSFVSQNKYNFTYISAWSYPALEIKAKLDRKLNGYETMEPFSRYGVYIQEIMHRTVYGTSETHFETKPGIVGNGGGFSMISNLGTSSIPFIEYLTVGRGQLIPSGTSTSRVTWKDIWGRTWHQPLRTVFPDVPPVPSPLKNFMMTTTYEILQNGEQIYEWPSDENAQIHLHIKLLNNYQKYFEITRCVKNQIRFVPKAINEYHNREFSAKFKDQLEDSDFTNSKNVFLRQGGYASYGSCFTEPGAIVGGKKVEGDFLKQIEKAKVCADFTNSEKIQQCEEELKDITTLQRVDKQNLEKGISGKKWNYSPTVESYYPKGYIEDDMWDLTHIDYDNNNMNKAYSYHMDNLIPNYDNGISKPHNVIAIPIYKGLGFSILYDKNNEMNYHGVMKKGWWSDNLQNKDDTLVAGQDKCNVISVNKESSLTNWVEGKDLRGNNNAKNSQVQNLINNRNKNIYVCLYNRRRPDFGPNTNKKYYTANVNQNNIVPIIVDLEKDDPRLGNYNCKGEQYTPDNIYTMEGNLLMTPTSKDYLYFAANLRGQAKESFNILMNLNNFDQIKYEGMVKVNEGGRFVYWNPANGPNSFLVVDNPVSIINAKRNDIEIENNLFPGRVDTFNAVVYHSYKFKDDKRSTIWPYTDFYANSYGFGDVSISVYVGGIRKSKAVVQPGETTYARIIFYNNCGFDWAMKEGAIEFENKGSKPISAYDLLERRVHAIRAPTKYNFLKYSVNKEYEQYLSIAPSDHNIEVAPEFFDFENINVVTIRDGFKGEYNLQVNVTKDFPKELRGKPIELKLELVTSYFDHFPRTSSDPIKSYHRYNVKVPSVYIGVPYLDGENKGKVLYTSAQASELDLSLIIGVDWNIDGVKYADKEILDKMKNATQNSEYLKELEEIWNKSTSASVSISEKRIDENNKKVTFDGIKKDYPLFPKIVKGAPDENEVTLLIRSSVHQIPWGQSYPIDDVKMTYKQWNGKKKESKGERPFIYGSGAWIELSYSRTLYDELPDGTYIKKPNQELYHEDEGIMRVDFKLRNVGDKDSYSTAYQIVIQKKLTYISHYDGLKEVSVEKDDEGNTIITFDLQAPINKGENFGSYIYLRYNKCVESVSNLNPEEYKNLPDELKITKQSAAILDLNPTKGVKQVTQYLRTPLSFPYRKVSGSLVYIDMILTGRRSNPQIEIKPKIKLENNDTLSDIKLKINKVDYTKYISKNLRNLAELGITVYEGNYSNYIDESPNEKEISNKEHSYTYIIQMQRRDKSFTSNRIKYNQKDIGFSIYELIAIIASIVFIALALIFLILGIKNLKSHKNDNLEKEVQNVDPGKLIEDE